jgi:hypothetical protein
MAVLILNEPAIAGVSLTGLGKVGPHFRTNSKRSTRSGKISVHEGCSMYDVYRTIEVISFGNLLRLVRCQQST